jgi:hypothetical protein
MARPRAGGDELPGPGGFLDTAFGLVLHGGVAGELFQQRAERSSPRASQLLKNGKSPPSPAASPASSLASRM